MTLIELDAELARLVDERATSDARYAAQIAKVREQRRLLVDAAREAAMRKRLANTPPEVLSALRQSLPLSEHEAILIDEGFAYRGLLCADWTGEGYHAKHTLHKIDKEKA